MSLYVKVFTSFFTHRKTMRLRAVLGDDAFWVPPRLWAYAAENQPDGDFSGYTDGELAQLIGYTKDASSMLQALLQAGFMDADRKIHDWPEHNGYHREYSERARLAAKAKWDKYRAKQAEQAKTQSAEEGTEKRGTELIGDKHCFKHASSRNPESEKEQKAMTPTPESTARYERLRVALHEAMRRKPKQHWDYAEMSLLNEVNHREGVEEELAELLAFQKRAGRYFPHSLYALLSRWSETLDQSRQPIEPNGTNRQNGQQVNGNTGTLNKPSAEKAARYTAIARRGLDKPV